MAKLNLKTMKKNTKDHLITFAMVIVVYTDRSDHGY